MKKENFRNSQYKKTLAGQENVYFYLLFFITFIYIF